MDKRRRRYVMHDVYFLDDTLGMAVFDMFGACGVALWMGFIAACKKNHIEGEMSYTTDSEALAVLGLPGLDLADSSGVRFTLDEFWTLLGDHKVTRRRRSGRRLHVACTRWEHWQVNPRRKNADNETGRSEPLITDTMQDDSEHIRGLETERETERERERETGVRVPAHRDLLRPNAAPPLLEEMDQIIDVLVNAHGPEKVTDAVRQLTDQRLHFPFPSRAREALETILGVRPPAPTPLDASQAAQRALMERQTRRANREACPTCEDRGMVLDETLIAGPCPDCRPEDAAAVGTAA